MIISSRAGGNEPARAGTTLNFEKFCSRTDK